MMGVPREKKGKEYKNYVSNKDPCLEYIKT